MKTLKKLKCLDQNNWALYVVVAVVLFLCSPLSNNMQQRMNHWLMRTHQREAFQTPIRILYFDEEDINQLGGWPLPRNVYAYIVQKIGQLGAKAIAFDIFWGDAHTAGNENDSLLQTMLSKEYPVVGSYYFDALRIQKPSYWEQLNQSGQSGIGDVSGSDLRLPSGMFLYSEAEFGFINLPLASTGAVENAIVHIALGDTVLPCFAQVIATQYSGKTTPRKNFTINYQVPSENMDFIPTGFINTKTDSDSLRALFDGSIVMVGVISDQFGFSKPTPVDPNMPLVAIHAQIVDNLIQETYLKVFPGWVTFGLLLLFACCSCWLKRFPAWVNFVFFAGLSAALLITTLTLWRIQMVFPYCFLQISIVVYCMVGLVFALLAQRTQVSSEIKRREKLEVAFSQKIRQASELEQEYFTLRQKYQEEIQGIRQVLNHVPQEEKNKLKEMFPQIICSVHGPMMQILSEMKRVAKTEEPVLITGETGTGKDLVAHGIYLQSNRADKQYIPINCGALSEQLLESELFGHEKGAFTGAVKTKTGFFEAADHGTIFLDEISETSLAFQAKLLRILQEGTFYRVGSTEPRQVNVRIIAATNRDLHASIQRGDFRQDLYFRLNVLPIEIPPLRERQADIPLLLFYFLGDQELQISQEAMRVLQTYHWPGNIRELQNVAARLRVLPEGSLVTPHWLTRQGGLQKSDEENGELDEQILLLYREFEFQNNSNVKIAEQLGHMHRSTITEYLKGLTFQFFFEEAFDLDKTIRRFNPHSDEICDTRIRKRILTYLANHIAKLDIKRGPEANQSAIQDAMRKVPQKYHDVIFDVSKAYLQGLWTL